MKKFVIAMCIALLATLLLCGTAFAITMPETTEYRCATCTRQNGGYNSDSIEWTVTTWTRQSVKTNYYEGYHAGIYKCNECGTESPMMLGQHTTSNFQEEKAPSCTESGSTSGKWCAYCGLVTEEPKQIEPTGHDYSGAEATCTTDQVCTRCNAVLNSALGHDFQPSTWIGMTSNGWAEVRYACTHDGCNEGGRSSTSDFTKIVVQPASCKQDEMSNVTVNLHMYICGVWYHPAAKTYTNVKTGEKLSHTPGAEATCTTSQTCTECGTELVPAKGHTPGTEATCTTAQTCTVCGAELVSAKGHTPGAEATCTTDQVCTRDNCGVVLNEKLGHDYAATVVQPTCIKKGYTTHTCTRCGDSYTTDEVGATGHGYSLWTPCGDGTHEADCNRSGCNYVGNRACTLCEVTIGDKLLNVCPVCGDYNVTPFAAITGAKAKAITRYALPRGELIVRGMVQPFEADAEQRTVLYAFTAAYEFAGAVEPFKGTVEIVVPMNTALQNAFKLVRVDVTPATETAERVEVWTEIPFTYEDGKLTFETDVEGLFLMILAE